ncbi:MAG: hypothetical protein WCK67_06600 [bacterium]
MRVGNISPPTFQSVSMRTASQPKISSSECPHGMPFGSCPACSGGGGGGGVAKKGQMSWNEGYGIWMSILSTRKNAEMRKEFFNQSLLADQTKNKLEISNTAKYLAAANSVLQSIKSFMQPLNNIKNAVASTMKEIQTIVTNLLSKASQVITDTQAKLTSALNAISAFLGEQQKILKEFLTKGLEVIKKLSFLKHAAENLGQFIAQKAKQITKHAFEKLNKAGELFNNLFKRLKKLAEKKRKKAKNKQKEQLNVDAV